MATSPCCGHHFPIIMGWRNRGLKENLRPSPCWPYLLPQLPCQVSHATTSGSTQRRRLRKCCQVAEHYVQFNRALPLAFGDHLISGSLEGMLSWSQMSQIFDGRLSNPPLHQYNTTEDTPGRVLIFSYEIETPLACFKNKLYLILSPHASALRSSNFVGLHQQPQLCSSLGLTSLTFWQLEDPIDFLGETGGLSSILQRRGLPRLPKLPWLGGNHFPKFFLGLLFRGFRR